MSTTSWKPSCTVDALQQRAAMLLQVRSFFAALNVMEVETPLMSQAGATDPHLTSLSVNDTSLRYLQTSPEFAMKRLLAAGSGAIFQICKAFRAGERGRKHNPEFSILEWYRPGYDLDDLMDECELLLKALGIQGKVIRTTYRDAFKKYTSIDPFTASLDELIKDGESCSGMDLSGWGRDDCLDLILSHRIEPHLGRGKPEFLIDYPASQAALAKLYERDGLLLARRFELYINGLELANGYHELTDPEEQAARFKQDNKLRRELGCPVMPVDHHLVSALRAGMPECAGVAVGMDRLLMALSQASSIDEVVAFPVERA